MKATITRRVDECTFQCGYEMRRCTVCGESARTVPVLLSLECGAELMGFVCKTCVHAATSKIRGLMCMSAPKPRSSLRHRTSILSWKSREWLHAWRIRVTIPLTVGL